MTTETGKTTTNAAGLSSRGFRTFSAARAYVNRLWESGRVDFYNVNKQRNTAGLFVASWVENPTKRNGTRKRNAGEGSSFDFHGAYTKKSDAMKKEAATPGSFIRMVPTASGFRFAVMTKPQTDFNFSAANPAAVRNMTDAELLRYASHHRTWRTARHRYKGMAQGPIRAEMARRNLKLRHNPALRFFYNGIKAGDGKLQKATYDDVELRSFPRGTITIRARQSSGFTGEVRKAFTVENDSDGRTDYFERDRIRVTPDHPLYSQVKAAMNANPRRRANVSTKTRSFDAATTRTRGKRKASRRPAARPSKSNGLLSFLLRNKIAKRKAKKAAPKGAAKGTARSRAQGTDPSPRPGGAVPTTDPQTLEDLASALRNEGYTSTDARKMAKAAAWKHPGGTFDTLFLAAMRRENPNKVGERISVKDAQKLLSQAGYRNMPAHAVRGTTRTEIEQLIRALDAVHAKYSKQNPSSPIEQIGADHYRVDNGHGTGLELVRKSWGWVVMANNAATRAWWRGRSSAKTYNSLADVERAYKAFRGISALLGEEGKKNPRPAGVIGYEIRWTDGGYSRTFSKKSAAASYLRRSRQPGEVLPIARKNPRAAGIRGYWVRWGNGPFNSQLFPTKRAAEQYLRDSKGRGTVVAVRQNPERVPFDVTFRREGKLHTWTRFAETAAKATSEAREALRREYPAGDYTLVSVKPAEMTSQLRGLGYARNPGAWVRLAGGIVARILEGKSSPKQRQFRVYIPGQGAAWAHGRVTAVEPTAEQQQAFQAYRRNPSAQRAAERKAIEFHGRKGRTEFALEYEGMTRAQAEQLAATMPPEDYTGLGALIELRTLPPGAGESSAVRILFDKPAEQPKVCCNPEGSQIYFVAGNQDCGELAKQGADIGFAMVDLGECYFLEYQTRKAMDQFQQVNYYHELGEETGERPHLLYSTAYKKLYLVGGAYDVRPEGIRN